jgi:hypothetical protein
MPRTFTESDVIEAIRIEVSETSLRQTARRIEVSAPYLSDILRGNRGVGEKVAEAFGFEREIQTRILFRRKAKAA